MNSESKKRSWRGVKLCVGIMLVGGAFLLGLFAMRPAQSPRVPEGVLAGIPKRPMRVVSFSMGTRSVDEMLQEVRELRPDIVMLQRVQARNVPAIVGAMNMAEAHHASNYQPTQNVAGKKSESGTLIMSRFKLYEAGGIRVDKVTFGVHATCVVDGRAFAIASVDFSSDSETRRREHSEFDRMFPRDRPWLAGSLGLIEKSRGWRVTQSEAKLAVLNVVEGE